MAYQKKKMPREVRRLENRLVHFKNVIEHSELDDITLLEAGQQQVDKVREIVNSYNEILRQADDLRTELENQTKIAQDIHERIRMWVIGRFGRDSLEYQRLGGVRKSNIDYSRTGSKKRKKNS